MNEFSFLAIIGKSGSSRTPRLFSSSPDVNVCGFIFYLSVEIAVNYYYLVFI